MKKKPNPLNCDMHIVTLSFLKGIVFFFPDSAEITFDPEAEIKSEGENLTLSCNATGNPVPTISWTKDGSPVNQSGRISFSADEKQLTITNVNRTDSGEYRCMASNSLGNDTSSASTVDIQCK